MRRLLLLLLMLNLSPLWAKCSPGPVSEQRFIEAGGIKQWLTIEGSNCANPVVLYVHGGPGNPLSPYGDALFASWRERYTVVLWDQRGSGMTYGANPPPEASPLTIELLRDDGLAVAQQVAQHLGQRKLILMGSSWGSVLAASMAQAKPELFHAYVGVAQVVDGRENEIDAYAQVLALARKASDAEHTARLEALGTPPWSNPRNFGVMRRAIRKYEALATDAAPKQWWKPGAIYTTPKAQADYEAGEDYSFLQFVGLHGDGMQSKIKLGAAFKLPVYLVQGEQDLLTSAAVTRRYFEQIKAPRKELFLVPRAGHDPNQPLMDAQFKVLEERVRPAL
ncbi:alpha/beta fold hydrolase [Pseudoduganella sp. OTU4001]|uniref:alpha/beta fold hydrolase n=1 Tax=Pseudoduganella sp. OTU4001 TaxID=3043854 RepID=UPI00313B67DF